MRIANINLLLPYQFYQIFKDKCGNKVLFLIGRAPQRVKDKPVAEKLS